MRPAIPGELANPTANFFFWVSHMSRSRSSFRPARPKPKAKRYRGSKTLLRELSDCRIYVVDGTAMDYEPAHKLASKIEQSMRKKWKDFPFLSDDWPVSLDLPGFFPRR
jgi:hypothetical protein